MSIYTRIDQVLLEYILRPNGKEQVGIYVHSFRIFDAAFQFAGLFAVLLLPMFSRMIKQKEPISQLTQLSFLLLIIPSLVLAFASMFYSEDIMGLLYPDNVGEAEKFFGIIMFAFASMTGTIIFGTLLTANGSIKVLNWISGIGVVINLSLNLILIPSLMAYGSAIACLVTQAVMAIVHLIVAKQIFKFKINIRLIILLIIFVVGIWLIGIFIKQLNMEWYLGFILMIFTGLLFATVIRLLNLRVIYEIVRFGDEK
jgi:O-antigen/teichoic acid export membrane protein